MRQLAVLVVAVLAVAGRGRAVWAQDTTEAVSAEAMRLYCDSVMSANVVDSGRIVARAILTRTDGGVLPRAFSALVMQEILSHLHLPQPLRIPVLEPGPIRLNALRPLHLDETVKRQPVLNAAYRFTIRKDGTASRPDAYIPSLAPGLDSAIEASITGVALEKAFPTFLDDAEFDSASVQLRLTSGGETEGVSIDMFASMFPMLRALDADLREAGPAPAYPEAERAAGVSGQVLFKVVVDTRGEPVLNTLEVRQATTRGFALSALEVVQHMRWSPARVGDCAVPQLVYVPIRFALPER